MKALSQEIMDELKRRRILGKETPCSGIGVFTAI